MWARHPSVVIFDADANVANFCQFSANFLCLDSRFPLFCTVASCSHKSQGICVSSSNKDHVTPQSPSSSTIHGILDSYLHQLVAVWSQLLVSLQCLDLYLMYRLVYLQDKYLFIFQLNLSGCYWLTQLYRVQVYNSMIHHLSIALCAYHPKSSHFLSPYIWPLHLLHPPSTPLPSGNHRTVVRVCEFLFLFEQLLYLLWYSTNEFLKLSCLWDTENLPWKYLVRCVSTAFLLDPTPVPTGNLYQSAFFQ